MHECRTLVKVLCLANVSNFNLVFVYCQGQLPLYELSVIQKQ